MSLCWLYCDFVALRISGYCSPWVDYCLAGCFSLFASFEKKMQIFVHFFVVTKLVKIYFRFELELCYSVSVLRYVACLTYFIFVKDFITVYMMNKVKRYYVSSLSFGPQTKNRQSIMRLSVQLIDMFELKFLYIIVII